MSRALPLRVVLLPGLRDKVSFHGQLAYLHQLVKNREAGKAAAVLNIRKVSRVDVYHFGQFSAGYVQSLPGRLYVVP